MVYFQNILWKCNKIHLDKVLMFCFSEIMGWEVIVTHQELSTPKCDGTCVDHARIKLRARVIRATLRRFPQSSIYLPSRYIFLQRVPWRPQFYMEFAIIIILYLAGFLGVFFCFFQLAGLLDKLTYQDQASRSDSWRSFSIHHGSPVRGANLDILVDNQCVPPNIVVSHDMLKLLPNSAYIYPPSRRKWDRAWTSKSELKSTVVQTAFNFSACPIRMTPGHINGLRIKMRCGFLTVFWSISKWNKTNSISR